MPDSAATSGGKKMLKSSIKIRLSIDIIRPAKK
jgi:hypothetical protein